MPQRTVFIILQLIAVLFFTLTVIEIQSIVTSKGINLLLAFLQSSSKASTEPVTRRARTCRPARSAGALALVGLPVLRLLSYLEVSGVTSLPGVSRRCVLPVCLSRVSGAMHLFPLTNYLDDQYNC